MENKLRCKVHNPECEPKKKHPGDAGWDVFARNKLIIGPGETGVVSVGISLACPSGTYFRVADKSGIAKNGLVVFAGVVDSTYRGEVKVLLHNITNQMRVVNLGQPVAQIIPTFIDDSPLYFVNQLETTKRGSDGGINR